MDEKQSADSQQLHSYELKYEKAKPNTYFKHLKKLVMLIPSIKSVIVIKQGCERSCHF